MKAKFLHCITVVCTAVLCASAQEATQSNSGWKYTVLTNLTLTLNTYSDNWAGGEFSAFSWAWQFNGTAEKALAPWVKSNNTLKLAFGQTALQDSAKNWGELKKSTDLIDLETMARFTLKSVVDPFVGVRVVSQFSDQRVENATYYGNPIVITESFGAIRDIIKNERLDWTARLGGALRQSIDLNEDTVVQPETIINDGGIEFVTNLKAKTEDNRISYLTQVKVYEALFSSIPGSDTLNEWRYPDVLWENTLGITLAKYIMLNLYAQLIYDKEIDDAVRWKNVVGLALTFSAANW